MWRCGWRTAGNYRVRLVEPDVDNIHLRIANDVYLFIQRTHELATGLLGSIVALASFAYILWGLSATTPLPIFGVDLAVPGYLIWTALAYAGIGRPRKFFDSLAAIGATVARTVSFPDHHPFTAAEATRLLSEAKSGGFRLVTTEKDFARISAASGPLAELKAASEAFAVTIEFENPAAVSGLIAEAVRRAAGR